MLLSSAILTKALVDAANHHNTRCAHWCETVPSCSLLRPEAHDACAGCDTATPRGCTPADEAYVAAALHGGRETHLRLSSDGSVSDPLPAFAHPTCDVQRIDAATLSARFPTTAERARFLQRPTIIEGLIDGWRASELRGLDAFRESGAGSLEIARDRLPRSFEPKAARANDRVAFRELGIDQWAELHVVLFSDWGTDEAKAATAALAPLYDVPAELNRTSCQIYSIGGGRTGALMSHHGFSWMGVVAGAKRWYVAPPEVPQPREPDCMPREVADLYDRADDPAPAAGGRGGGVFHCLQRPGEVFVLPESWWHATCNVGRFTLGLGGQDPRMVNGVPRVDPALADKQGRGAAGGKSVDWKLYPIRGAVGDDKKIMERELPL